MSALELACRPTKEEARVLKLSQRITRRREELRHRHFLRPRKLGGVTRCHCRAAAEYP